MTGKCTTLRSFSSGLPRNLPCSPGRFLAGARTVLTGSGERISSCFMAPIQMDGRGYSGFRLFSWSGRIESNLNLFFFAHRTSKIGLCGEGATTATWLSTCLTPARKSFCKSCMSSNPGWSTVVPTPKGQIIVYFHDQVSKTREIIFFSICDQELIGIAFFELSVLSMASAGFAAARWPPFPFTPSAEVGSPIIIHPTLHSTSHRRVCVQ